jgi:AcrR family transcriptional regulator
MPVQDEPSTRELVIRSAYQLFAHRGIRDVSLLDIEISAGVSTEMLAAEFASKDDLAIAFLERRERDWTFGMVEAGARLGGETPEQQLLAIFDVFHEWFHRDDYEACSFINVMLELGTEHPLGIASAGYLTNIRNMVTDFAREAGLRDPEEFARSWHILMKGSIISAVEGDTKAALRAKDMARSLISKHRKSFLPVAEQSGTDSGSWIDLDYEADYATFA